MRDNALDVFEFQSTLPLRGVTKFFRLLLHTGIFQSTLPLRGVTFIFKSVCKGTLISIHTPLAGSDTPGRCSPITCRNFNPHSPCGE